MKFEIEHIGNIQSASIELDGITLIAGDNSSGKTTIAKALYGTLSPLNQLDYKIFESRMDSISRFASEWFSYAVDSQPTIEKNTGFVRLRRFRNSFGPLLSITDEVLKNDFVFTEEYLVDFVLHNVEEYKNTTFVTSEKTDRAIRSMNDALHRSDKDYASMIFAQELNNQFKNQIRTFDYPSYSEIRIDSFLLQFIENEIEEMVLPDSGAIFQGGSVVCFSALREFSNMAQFSSTTNLPELIRKSSI